MEPGLTKSVMSHSQVVKPAVVVSDELSVDPDSGVAVNPVEAQEHALAGEVGGDIELPFVGIGSVALYLEALHQALARDLDPRPVG